MAINAARLMVDIDASVDGLRSGMNEADTLLGKGVKGMAGFATAATVAGVAAGTAFGVSAVMGASDLAETLSKVGVVFGDQQQLVQDYANQMAADFGIPKQSILDATASIGLIGKASGLSQKEAAGMSTQLAQMAVDASSFYNVPLEEALAAIQSGLVGEAEPMRRFGVLLNEDAVAAEALRLGLTKNTKEMTEGMKAQARASLITKGMTDASGDLARTQDSLSNRMRALQGRIENFSTSVGTRMLPYVLRAWDATEKWAGSMRTKLAPVMDDLADIARNLANRDIAGLGVGIGSLFGLMEDSAATGIIIAGLQGIVDVAQFLGPMLPELAIAAAALFGAFAAVQTVNSAAGAINGFIDNVAGMPQRMAQGTAEIRKLADTLGKVKSKTISVVQSGAETAALKVMYLQDALANLRDRTVTITQNIRQQGGNTASAARGAVAGFAGGIAAAIVPALAGVASTVGSAILAFFASPIVLGALAVAAVVAVGALVYKFREEIGGFLKKVPGWFADGMKALGTWLITDFPRFIGQALGFGLGMLLNLFVVWPLQAGAAIAAAAPGLWQKFMDLVTGVKDRLVAGFTTILTNVWDFMVGIGTKVGEGVSAVVAWFQSLPEKIMWFINDVRERGIWAFIDLGIRIADTVSNFVSTVLGFIGSLPGKALEFFGGLASSAIGKLVDLVNWVKGWSIVAVISSILTNVRQGFAEGFQKANEASQGKLGELVEFVRGIPGRILGAIGDLGATLYTKGQDVIQGLINGIRNKIGAVGDAMKEVTGKIGGFLPGSPVKEGPLSGRHEPFRLGQAVGNQIAAGLASVTPTLNTPMAGLTGALAGAGAGSGGSGGIIIAEGAVQFHGLGADMDETTLTRVVEAGFRQLAREVAVR